MNAKKKSPPSQAEVERRFHQILEHGDIEDLSDWLDIPYQTLNKQLNPNNPTAKSDFYRFARQMWAIRQLEDGERKAWLVIDLLTELIFPSADALQLVNRMESDLGRLKTKLSEGAH